MPDTGTEATDLCWWRCVKTRIGLEKGRSVKAATRGGSDTRTNLSTTVFSTSLTNRFYNTRSVQIRIVLMADCVVAQ